MDTAPKPPTLGIVLFVGGILCIFLAFVISYAMTPVDGSPNTAIVGGLMASLAALVVLVIPGGVIISRSRR